MATIAIYKPNGREYLVVGTGFGAVTHVSQGFMGFKSELGDSLPMVVVADASGKLHWVRSDDLQIVSVDGAKLADVLRPVRPQDTLPLIDPDA